MLNGNFTTGAANDIEKVTELAGRMVREWAMSGELGFLNFTDKEKQSEATKEAVDAQIRAVAEDIFKQSEALVNENWGEIVNVAEALLERETLEADEIKAVLRGEKLPPIKSASSAPPAGPAL